MKKLSFAFAIAVGLVSCSTQQTVTTQREFVDETYEHMESSVRLLEPEHSMFLTPIIADLKVSSTKIQYVEKEMFKDMEITKRMIEIDMPELKKIALSRAARAHNADVLVGATLDVITKDGRIEIYVSGYPATYVAFRNIEDKDIKKLKDVRELNIKKGSDIIDAPNSVLNLNVEEVEVKKITK